MLFPPYTGYVLSVRTITLDESGRVAPEEHARFAPWWEARGGQAPTREMLPGMGAVAAHDGEPVAVCFMYLDATGSGVAWLAWLATRPRAGKVLAGQAINHLVGFLLGEAKRLNYWLVSAVYHHRSVVTMLRGMGFLTADTGMTQLFKPL